MKLTLSISAVLLFCLSYTICNLIYNPCTQTNQWWDLRLNLYAITILLYAIVTQLQGNSKHIRFVLSVGIGLSASDVIDRLFLDITTFTKEDVLMIILTLIISYFESYKRHEQAKKLSDE